jgi:hypothetical protein
MRNTMMTEHRWDKELEAAKNEAEKLPHGKKREALERKIQRLETATKINRWISSPGLEPPR